MRDHVKIFAEQMEEKLQSKDKEYGTEGYMTSDCSLTFLTLRLEGEFYELLDSLNQNNQLGITEEAIDIANFAMMIYHKIKGKEQCQKQNQKQP